MKLTIERKDGIPRISFEWFGTKTYRLSDELVDALAGLARELDSGENFVHAMDLQVGLSTLGVLNGKLHPVAPGGPPKRS